LRIDPEVAGLRPGFDILDADDSRRMVKRVLKALFAWEDRVVAPRDGTRVERGAAQAMVDAIWMELGLRYPPRVERLPAQATATLASANRLSLFLPAQTASFCVLHELAHAMTSTEDGRSDGHGPVFVGIYLQLLVRYMRFYQLELLGSFRQAGIRVTPDAQPMFVDP
jgi:hypothetical protein